MNTFLFVVAVVLLTAAGSTLGSAQYSSSSTDHSCNNIASVFKKNGLTKLLDLATKFGLIDEILSGNAPRTGFAPTNEAFASIDPHTLKIISEDRDLLKDILAYHVVPFEIPPAFLSSTQQVYQLPTLQGSAPVRINVYRENAAITFDPVKTVTVNGALVLRKLKSCKGYVYVIDKVLNPADLMPENDELEILDRYGLTTLKKIFDIVGFTPVIFFRPETIFAPTDAAFAALPPGFLDELLVDEKKLFTFINNHVVSGYRYSRGLETGPVLTTSGITVEVKVTPGGVTFGAANVVIPDITNEQGVIHVIDAVILPDLEYPAVKKSFY